MNYKGIELKEVTEPQTFDPPKKMLVWDNYYECLSTANVCAIINRKDFRVISENAAWRHCAEIPEVHESELVTNRELACWLAGGNGEAKIVHNVFINWTYGEIEDDKNVEDNVSVRRWDDTEWHKPTKKYLGLEDK